MHEQKYLNVELALDPGLGVVAEDAAAELLEDADAMPESLAVLDVELTVALALINGSRNTCPFSQKLNLTIQN